MEQHVYIFGASGHAKVVLDVLFSQNIQVVAVLDDNPKVTELLHIPVGLPSSFSIPDTSTFIVAVGDNAIRKKIANTHNFNYFTAVHAAASVSRFATLGAGTVVMPQAVVNADSRIGNHCILNSRSVVEHDCVLEDYVHISPNASLAGNVSVGEGTHIGIGASVIQGIKIGKWATIGAGAVIIEDVADYAVVVGNPGKVIKHHTP